MSVVGKRNALEKQRKNAAFRTRCWFVCVVGVALLIPFGALGCGVQENERDAAHELLERISRLDPNAPIEARSAALSALEALPLDDAELRAMRAVCVAAHRGLLEAERGQAGVRARLDGPKPEPEQLAALQAAMQKASAQLASAQTAMADCEAKTRKATLEYR